MFLYCKEKKYLIVSLITILLDGLILYFVPSYFNKINFFYPMLTISLISFLYHDNEKQFYYFIIFMGIIYDILYTNILLYNVILFLIIAIIDVKILKCFKNHLLLFLLIIILNISIYDVISFSLIILTSYQSTNIYDLIYKLEHSVLLNILSGFVFFFLFKKERRYA